MPFFPLSIFGTIKLCMTVKLFGFYHQSILLIFSCVNYFFNLLNDLVNEYFFHWLINRSCNQICCSLVFTKKTCVVTKMCCILLTLVFPDLLWCWWHIIKKIFHAIFCLISKLFTLGNSIFNSTSRRWILIALGE